MDQEGVNCGSRGGHCWIKRGTMDKEGTNK